MPIETRIFKNIRKSSILLEKKLNFFKKKFSISVLFIFIGFFIGNIFGTFLNWLRHFIVWDGLLIFVLLLFFEIISSIVYQNSPTFVSQPISRGKTFFSDFFLIKNIFLKIALFREQFKKADSSNISILENKNFEYDTISFKSTNESNFQIGSKKLKVSSTTYFSFFRNLPIWRLLNCLKVGILFGFFIDAFKVGS